jgi:acyl-CoA thioesterase YciA
MKEPIAEHEKAEGELVIRTVAMAADTNFNGDIFGGWVMSQMDMGAGIVAARCANKRVTTVAVDKIVFLNPVKVGDIVSCYGQLLSIGNTSMKIKIEVWILRKVSNSEIKVTEGLFTFVAIDNNGRPTPVKA